MASMLHVGGGAKIYPSDGCGTILKIDDFAHVTLLTGAVASVWGRGTSRQIVTPTLTAGIRGTGVYTEVFPQQNFRSYFCNCYGTVEMGAGPDRALSESEYHQAFWGEPVESWTEGNLVGLWETAGGG